MDMTQLLESPPEPAAPPVVVDGAHLTLDDVVAVARGGAPVTLAAGGGVREAIEASRRLRRDVLDRGVPIYGVTTGFGDSVHRQIAPDEGGGAAGAPRPQPRVRDGCGDTGRRRARGRADPGQQPGARALGVCAVELVERLLRC